MKPFALSSAAVVTLLCASQAISATLVADYKFNNAGNVVQDSSGNGFDGTNAGGLQGTAPGGGGYIAVSGGTYAVTPSLGGPGTGPLGTTDRSVSVSSWFNATPGGNNGVIVTELGGATPNNGWHDSQIELETSGAVNTAVWQYSDGNTGGGSVAQGQWHLATFTYDSSTLQLTEYIDGLQVSQITRGADRQTPWANGGSPQFYAFGPAESTTLGNGSAFSGLIGETKIYNGALSATDVASQYATSAPLYSAVPEPSSLVLCGLAFAGLLAVRRKRG